MTLMILKVQSQQVDGESAIAKLIECLEPLRRGYTVEENRAVEENRELAPRNFYDDHRLATDSD